LKISSKIGVGIIILLFSILFTVYGGLSYIKAKMNTGIKDVSGTAKEILDETIPFIQNSSKLEKNIAELQLQLSEVMISENKENIDENKENIDIINKELGKNYSRLIEILNSANSAENSLYKELDYLKSNTKWDSYYNDFQKLKNAVQSEKSRIIKLKGKDDYNDLSSLMTQIDRAHIKNTETNKDKAEKAVKRLARKLKRLEKLYKKENLECPIKTYENILDGIQYSLASAKTKLKEKTIIEYTEKIKNILLSIDEKLLLHTKKISEKEIEKNLKDILKLKDFIKIIEKNLKDIRREVKYYKTNAKKSISVIKKEIREKRKQLKNINEKIVKPKINDTPVDAKNEVAEKIRNIKQMNEKISESLDTAILYKKEIIDDIKLREKNVAELLKTDVDISKAITDLENKYKDEEKDSQGKKLKRMARLIQVQMRRKKKQLADTETYTEELIGKLVVERNMVIQRYFYIGGVGQNGYAYLVPFGKDMLSIAITSFTKSDFKTISERFEKFLKTDKIIKETINGSKRLNSFAGFGHFNVPETAIYKYKYFVGGAAGFVDPARGFGTKYAILSGAMAAKSILNKKLNYDELWKKEFKQELSDGFNRRILLNKLTSEDYEKFVKEEKLNIKNYEKVPNGIKEIFFQINGKVHLRNWQKKFDLSNIINL